MKQLSVFLQFADGQELVFNVLDLDLNVCALEIQCIFLNMMVMTYALY